VREANVLSDRVPPPAAGELGVVRHQGGAAVGGADGDGVVGRIVEVRLGAETIFTGLEQGA
jgi:hypothetical protein